MTIWKTPPVEKIYEAFSAIADGRVTLKEESASVTSSDNSKEYIVEWKDNTYSSNDNASYWQGYFGYPVIAVLLLQGKLPFNKSIAGNFKGINWKKLNTEYRNNYSKALSKVYESLSQNGVDCNAIKEEVDKIYEKLKSLKLQYKRSHIRPPR